jgi:hypothetical protein
MYGWDEAIHMFKTIVRETPRKSEIKAKEIWQNLKKENPEMFIDTMRQTASFSIEEEFLRKYNLTGPMTVIFLGAFEVDVDTFGDYYPLHYRIKIRLKRWLKNRKNKAGE